MPERIIKFREAIYEAMYEEMIRDTNVFIMGEDVKRTVPQRFRDEFDSKRLVNTPLSEEGFTGLGVGAALTGLRPIVDMTYTDFILLAMDAVVNQAAKASYMFGGHASVPLVIRTHCGAGRGNAAQHSQSLEALFTQIPGLITIMPATPYDAKGHLKSSLRSNNPIIFIENKNMWSNKGLVPEDEYLVPIGRSDIKRVGKDLTIVATSSMVVSALSASEKLAQEGVDIEVVDVRTLVPLDIETITRSIKKTHRLLVINQGPHTSGFAAELVARTCETTFSSLEAPVVRLTSRDVPVPFSQALEASVFPTEAQIVDAVKDILSK